jgi:hypothetical protein
MTRYGRASNAIFIPLVGLALLFPSLTTSPATSASAGPQGTISISPKTYVGGQYVTISGNIGRTGRQTVRLQGSMGRPGDTWSRLESQRTDEQGNFSFSLPAPSMFGIQRRVVAAGGLQTPVLYLVAKSQDLVVSPVGQPQVGRPFTLNVDTTPALHGRPDLPPPAFPNRTLTLQRRDGAGWKTLDTTKTDADGNGEFSVTAQNAGVVDYRVRQENYFVNYHEIGWFPSFPTRVRIAPRGSRLAQRAVAPAVARSSANSVDMASVVAPFARSSLPATPASAAHGWNPSLFDFGWEHGESLTSPPQRGIDRRGWWVDGSTGYGRAAKHNGGMMLDSKRENRNGAGDRGRTWVTMRGNPRAYGRWEVRIRLKSSEANARDYRAKVELIPNGKSAYRCGGQNITIAELRAHSHTMKFGAKSTKANKQWTGRKRVGNIQDLALAVAVEVSKRHISWFLNSKLIGTVRNSAVVSDVPLTLRLSLNGVGNKEMNRTKAIFDWMRGFSLKRGKLTTGGRGLKSRGYRGGC